MGIFLLLVLVTVLMMPLVAVLALWLSVRLMRIREPGFGIWLATSVGGIIGGNFIGFVLTATFFEATPAYLAVAVSVIFLTLAVSFIALKYPIAWYRAAGVFVVAGVLMLAIGLGSREIVGAALTTKTTVNDGGMLPALSAGDTVMTFRAWPYYRRGDLAEVHGKDEADVLVRRIVGLPGEKIELVRGELYVNDALTPVHTNGKVTVDGATVVLPEEYRDHATNMAARTLGNDEYFVLADNPELRLGAGNGVIRKSGDEFIKGKVIFKVRGSSIFSQEGISMFPLE